MKSITNNRTDNNGKAKDNQQEEDKNRFQCGTKKSLTHPQDT